SREALVVAGYRLAVAAEGGWDSERARAAMRDYARVLRQDINTVAPVVAAHAREAARIAGFYGCEDAAARIPQPMPDSVVAPVEGS
ncbi:UNVERIFIED_CONTAM: GAF domain-containing protein, partial [Salmonella enterica subsp. enterica serovar Weltevreden]